MNWKTPSYSKNQIIQAGKLIKSSYDINSEEYKNALMVIDNWRASHAYPLQVIYCNLKRNYATANIKKNSNLPNNKIIVAQRLKRLNSIVAKLKREPTMSLWTMQDLGGCRVITPKINDVYSIVNQFKNSSIRHKLKKENDYINQPKFSGYRSYHMVYQYVSDKKDDFNRNMLIEIQVRTQLQHLWATAIETVDIFTQQAYKASVGNKNILRFFKLVSACFALEEKCNPVPDTPLNLNDLKKEILEIDNKENIFDMLSAIRAASYEFDKGQLSNKKSGYFILAINYKLKSLSIYYYKTKDITFATEKYNILESHKAEENYDDVVLISVSSFNKIKYAYPNYFIDIKRFINKVKDILKI